MARTNASIKNNPQFKALVAALGSEEKAKVAFDKLRPSTKVDPRVQTLLDAGFTEEEATAALAEKAAPVEKAAPATSKERGDQLREKQGFEYAKGRVYATGTLAEAIVRVLKSGKPEIVASSGVGRTKAVLVYREESGDVTLQNLTKSE